MSALDSIIQRLTVGHDKPLSVGFKRAAQLTGVSEWSLRRMAAADELPYRRIRGRIVIPMHALEALVHNS